MSQNPAHYSVVDSSAYSRERASCQQFGPRTVPVSHHQPSIARMSSETATQDPLRSFTQVPLPSFTHEKVGVNDSRDSTVDQATLGGLNKNENQAVKGKSRVVINTSDGWQGPDYSKILQQLSNMNQSVSNQPISPTVSGSTVDSTVGPRGPRPLEELETLPADKTVIFPESTDESSSSDSSSSDSSSEYSSSDSSPEASDAEQVVVSPTGSNTITTKNELFKQIGELSEEEWLQLKTVKDANLRTNLRKQEQGLLFSSRFVAKPVGRTVDFQQGTVDSSRKTVDHNNKVDQSSNLVDNGEDGFLTSNSFNDKEKAFQELKAGRDERRPTGATSATHGCNPVYDTVGFARTDGWNDWKQAGVSADAEDGPKQQKFKSPEVGQFNDKADFSACLKDPGMKVDWKARREAAEKIELIRDERAQIQDEIYLAKRSLISAVDEIVKWTNSGQDESWIIRGCKDRRDRMESMIQQMRDRCALLDQWQADLEINELGCESGVGVCGSSKSRVAFNTNPVVNNFTDTAYVSASEQQHANSRHTTELGGVTNGGLKHSSKRVTSSRVGRMNCGSNADDRGGPDEQPDLNGDGGFAEEHEPGPLNQTNLEPLNLVQNQVESELVNAVNSSGTTQKKIKKKASREGGRRKTVADDKSDAAVEVALEAETPVEKGAGNPSDLIPEEDPIQPGKLRGPFARFTMVDGEIRIIRSVPGRGLPITPDSNTAGSSNDVRVGDGCKSYAKPSARRYARMDYEDTDESRTVPWGLRLKNDQMWISDLRTAEREVRLDNMRLREGYGMGSDLYKWEQVFTNQLINNANRLMLGIVGKNKDNQFEIFRNPDFRRAVANTTLNNLFDKLLDEDGRVTDLQDKQMEFTMLRGCHIKCETVRWQGDDHCKEYEPVVGGYVRMIDWLSDKGWDAITLASLSYALWTRGYSPREAADALRGCVAAPTMSFMFYAEGVDNSAREELEGPVVKRREKGLPMIATRASGHEGGMRWKFQRLKMLDRGWAGSSRE